MNQILDFYNHNPFPGYYTIQQIVNYNIYNNRYISTIDRNLTNNIKVLDVGCGTGLITNIFALRYPESSFTGIDFSNSAEYAYNFANTHKIKNVNFIKEDFFQFNTNEKFDVIIAQSFLTHVQKYSDAITKLKNLLKPDGIIILGVYHPSGKLLKKFYDIEYGNERLKLDQEKCPYEISFNTNQVKKLFQEFKFLTITPSFFKKLVGLINIFNYKNGGLTLYVLKKTPHVSVIEKDIWDWIINFIEVPHKFYDYKFAVCPYAQAARLKGIVKVDVYEQGDVKDFIKNNIQLHLKDQKHEILILTMPPIKRFTFGIKKLIENVNKDIIKDGYYCQYGSAINTVSKYSGIFNKGNYFVVLVNKLKPVLEGHKALLKTDYYKKWDKKHYDTVVVRRQQMFDNYKNGKTT